MTMTMTRSAALPLAIALALALLAGGCAKKAKPTSTPETPVVTETAEAPPKPEAPPPVAEPFPPSQVDTAPVATPTIDELNRRGVLKTVYFAYNSEDLDDTARATLQANADWLKANAKYRVEIGGHCDERGSIGYNVALGDRRAASVRSYLGTLGVDASRLTAVSYGEERPADPGHDETAWAKNRRAEFKIQS